MHLGANCVTVNWPRRHKKGQRLLWPAGNTQRRHPPEGWLLLSPRASLGVAARQKWRELEGISYQRLRQISVSPVVLRWPLPPLPGTLSGQDAALGAAQTQAAAESSFTRLLCPVPLALLQVEYFTSANEISIFFVLS